MFSLLEYEYYIPYGLCAFYNAECTEKAKENL